MAAAARLRRPVNGIVSLCGLDNFGDCLNNTHTHTHCSTAAETAAATDATDDATTAPALVQCTCPTGRAVNAF